MCDYSLHGVKNRLAAEGEELVLHRFHTGSKGLASITDLQNLEKPEPAPAGDGFWTRIERRFWDWLTRSERLEERRRGIPAVCVPPGARLMVSGLSPALKDKYTPGDGGEATFTQVTAEAFEYRDALIFRDGKEVLLQSLNEGARVRVLELAPAEIEDQPRVFSSAASTRSFT